MSHAQLFTIQAKWIVFNIRQLSTMHMIWIFTYLGIFHNACCKIFFTIVDGFLEFHLTLSIRQVFPYIDDRSIDKILLNCIIRLNRKKVIISNHKAPKFKSSMIIVKVNNYKVSIFILVWNDSFTKIKVEILNVSISKYRLLVWLPAA